MANATKTFKIGEYCAGGIITAQIKGDEVTLINKAWDHSAGDRRSSDQSNAEELSRITVNVEDSNAERRLDNFLNLLTTCYYAEEVLKWVKSKVKLSAYEWMR